MATRASKVTRLINVRLPNSDAPAAGCKVYVYKAGTLAILDNTVEGVWTDADKSSPASRPIVLDSSGSAEVYAQGDLRFKVFDSSASDDSGTPLYDWDQLDYRANRTLSVHVTSSSYTLSAYDHETVVTCDTNTAGAITLTLPAEEDVLAPIVVMNTGSSSNDVTVRNDAGSTVITIADGGASLLYVSGGSWRAFFGTASAHSDQDFIWREGGANSRMNSGANLEFGASSRHIRDDGTSLIVSSTDSAGWTHFENSSGFALVYNGELSGTAATGWKRVRAASTKAIMLDSNGLRYFEASSGSAGSDIDSWDVVNGGNLLISAGGSYARMDASAMLEFGASGRGIYEASTELRMKNLDEYITLEGAYWRLCYNCYRGSSSTGFIQKDGSAPSSVLVAASDGPKLYKASANGSNDSAINSWDIYNGISLWHSGNDGSGSWLDADKVKGFDLYSGALVYRVTNQSIPDATWTAINYDSEEYDTDSIHDNSVNNSRLTVPSGVNYVRLKARIGFAPNSNGYREAYFYKNGSSTFKGNALAISDNLTGLVTTVLELSSPVLSVTAGDYFEVLVYQDSGANLDTFGGNYYWFAMEIMG